MKRAAFLLLLVGGCTPKSPEAVADKFVDFYFVEIDQKRALPLTSGLARSKIEEELSLVADIRRTYEPEQASKPSVFYQRRTLLMQGDHARVSYDITVRQGRDQTTRNALVSLERTGGKWTVGNFIVSEGHLPAPPPSSAGTAATPPAAPPSPAEAPAVPSTAAPSAAPSPTAQP
jgi:hypothetical protein